jgi:DNA-directed RNA polymerase specialized sigma24 family protein
MQVRSGLLSAQEAARQLGISRKTYYKWERRALAAMVEALGAQNRLGMKSRLHVK